jgi:amino acid adenylation domain-containing protein
VKDRKATGGAIKLSALEQTLLDCLLEEEGVDVQYGPKPILSVQRPADRLPLSFGQERLWFLEQLIPGTAAYHIPEAFLIKGALNVALLERAFNEIVRRHEVLRTTFNAVNGLPSQNILKSLKLSLPLIDLRSLGDSQRDGHILRLASEQARRPFDLERGPLLRPVLAQVEDRTYVLFITMHHIISDGWSLNLMTEEIAAIYGAAIEGRPATLPPLPVQYADFAIWERESMQGDLMKAQMDYWRQKLGNNLLPLDLQTDHPRPPVQTLKGAFKLFSLSPSLAGRINALCAEEGTTLFLALMSAFSAVLHRCSGQEDFTVGTPVANRNLDETKQLIGFFVNSLILRLDFGGNPTYREVLRRVTQVALEGYDNQDLPFDKLVEALQLERDLSRAPLHQAIFAIQNSPKGAISLPGITMSPLRLEVELAASRSDLSLFVWDENDSLGGALEYSTELFKATTIERFIEFFKAVLEDMVASLDWPILKLPPLIESAAEKARVEEKRLTSDSGAGLQEAMDLVYEQSNMTENQLLFWFSKKIQPDVRLYFERVAGCLDIKGQIDVELFQIAFQRLVDDSDALRSVIREVDGLPQRKVKDSMPATPVYEDFSGCANPYAQARGWIDERSRGDLDLGERLFDCSLLKIGPARFLCYLDIHHVIADVWSAAIIVRAISRYYALLGGRAPEDVKPSPPYQDYVDYDRRHRRSEKYRKAEAYWSAKLSEPVSLCTFYSPTSFGQSTRTERISCDIGRERTRTLKEITNQERLLSPAVVLAAALLCYLHRIQGERTLRIGSPFANRTDAFKNTIGLFISVCPLQVDVDDADTFLEAAIKFQAETIRSARHQHYPVRNPAEDKVYNVYFNYQNASFAEFCGFPAEFDMIHSGHSNDTLTLQAQDFNDRECLILEFDFKVDAFDREQRSRSVDYYLRILDAFLQDRNRALHSIDILPSEERSQVLLEFNQTGKTYAPGSTLHRLIERRADEAPHAIAVAYEDQELSYCELNRRANQLARHLRELGVGPDAAVAVCLDRSVEMVVGLLAILKAGGAYAPIDPLHPSRRVRLILEQLRPAAIISERGFADKIGDGWKTVYLDTDWPSIGAQGGDNLTEEVCAENLAYIIYTSGSTGAPKGVMIPHEGICNRLMWMQDAYGLGSDDRVLQKTPYTFDVSVWEFFWPLMAGARLVVARPGGHQDSAYLAETIAARKVTTVHFVPAMLQAFLSDGNGSECRSLKRVICSGEALAYETEQQFFQRFDCQLHNLYGPTEASVDVTHWTCNKDSERAIVPIGRPIANTQMYITDQWNVPVPLGIAGELLIGGVGLARGYFNRPDLTAERFIPDPFGPKAGGRLYRTGDLARYLPDGEIEFLGRIDHQVKIRGFRIETGEIEFALSRSPDVREAVVLAREAKVGDRRLVAYVVPGEGRRPAAGQLRSFLMESLPDYMVPSTFMFLEKLPVTPNGKLDRRALPSLDRIDRSIERDFVPPSSDLEKIIADVWREVLGLSRVGVYDNFFELGGHSLLATQVTSRLQKLLQLKIPLSVVFEAPTISQLAGRIFPQYVARQNDEEKEMMLRLLSEVETLSDGEVDDLLLGGQA